MTGLFHRALKIFVGDLSRWLAVVGMASFAPAAFDHRAAAVLLLAAGGWHTAVGAETAAPRHFDLPAGAAATMLPRFAEQAGAEVVFSTEATARVRTNAVFGRLAPEIALATLLRGTGLVAERSARTGAFTILRAPPPTAHPPAGKTGSVSDPQPQPKATVTQSPRSFVALLAGWLAVINPSAEAQTAAAAVPSDTVVLPSFQVSTGTEKGYAGTHALGASRFNIAISDVPQTVVVLNEQMLSDVAAVNLGDVAKYVSGVNSASTPSNGQLALRGYNIPGATLLNGLPDARTVGGHNLFDPLLVSRVEIIKGPAGTLYGSHTLGGIVNRVSKLPQAHAAWQVKAAVDGDETYRFDIDATGPVTADGRLRYRLLAGRQDGEMSWGGTHNDRTVVSGVVGRELGPRTQIRARLEVIRDWNGGEASQWFLDREKNISYFLGARFHSAEFDELRRSDLYFFDAEFEHAWRPGASQWAVRAVVRGYQHDLFTQADIPSNAFALSAIGARLGSADSLSFSDPRIVNYEITRFRRREFNDARSLSAFVDVSGAFRTGPVSHQLLAYATTGSGKGTGQNTEYVFPSVRAFNRTFLAQPDAARGAGTLRADTASDSDGFAAGVQDNLSLLDNRLILVAGARYDWMDIGNRDYRLGLATRETERDWSFRQGVVAKPIRSVSLYFNHGQTFTPVAGFDERTNSPLKNLEGSIDEVGVKLELLDRSLVATISRFDMSLKNAILTISRLEDPAGIGYRTQAGVQTTDGWDADLAWQPTRRWALVGGIGELTSRNETGRRNRNVAEGLNWRILAKYTQPEGPLKGLSVGAGYVFVNERAGDATDTFTLPDYFTWDAFAAYRRGRWGVQVNVYNLTDELYAQTSVNARRIFAGEPRKVRLTTTLRF